MKKITQLSRFKIRWLITKTLILILLGVFYMISNNVYAQTPMHESIFTPSSSNIYPLSTAAPNNRVQWLYLTSEIAPAPAGPGLITKIYLRIGAAGGATTFTNLKVSLGTTPQTVTTTTFIPGLQLCYLGTAAVYPAHATGDWLEITLQTPFLWNPTENLVVEVSQEGYTVGRSMWQYSSNGNRRTWGASNPTTPTGSAGTGQVHLGFDMMPATPCSGTVSAGVASASVTNACAAVPFNLSLAGATYALGVTYQWQSSPQGAGTFTDIPGASASFYTVANQTTPTDYRCIVTCTNNNNTQTSNVVSVGQNPYTACYCTPTYSYACSNTSENINSFIIEGEGTSVISDLNTGCSTGNYQNRTSVFAPVDLLQDSEYGVQVNTNYSSAQYVWASLWIDFNDNGAFESSEQLIKDVPMVTSPSFLNLSITIPDTAPAGVHRMRVRANYNATVDACSNGSWGETHDYNVNVIAITCYRPLDVQLSAVTKNSALVTITDNTKNTGSVTYEYEVRESGKPGSGTTGLAASGTATTNPFPVSGLQPLTKYTVYVKTVCSSTDSSGWSKSDEVSTMCDYPTLIAAPGKTVCGPQEVDLTAIFDAGTVKWYDTVTKDSLLYTGANFITPVLAADTSYWVQAGNSSDLSGAVGDGIIADGGTWNFLYNGWEGVKAQ